MSALDFITALLEGGSRVRAGPPFIDDPGLRRLNADRIIEGQVSRMKHPAANLAAAWVAPEGQPAAAAETST